MYLGGVMRPPPPFLSLVWRASQPTVSLALIASCGGARPADQRYPAQPEGCAVQLFHTKVRGPEYDDIGRVVAYCGNDVTYESCVVELKNQTCKLGGDIVYDVPEEPARPTPDKVRLTGRAAHSRGSK
jgi:hypothetical protein